MWANKKKWKKKIEIKEIRNESCDLGFKLWFFVFVWFVFVSNLSILDSDSGLPED